MCLIRRWFKYKFFLRKYKLTCNDKNFWLKSDHIQTFGVHNNQLYRNSCYETTNMYSVNKVPFSVNTPINIDLYLHKNSFIHIWTILVQYPFKISKRLCSNLFASRFSKSERFLSDSLETFCIINNEYLIMIEETARVPRHLSSTSLDRIPFARNLADA